MGLQIPHIWAAFSAPSCYALHRIALPVVSERCQMLWITRHSEVDSHSMSTYLYLVPNDLLQLLQLHLQRDHRQRTAAQPAQQGVLWLVDHPDST